MENITIKEGASLNEYIENLLEASYKRALANKALEEKEKQQASAQPQAQQQGQAPAPQVQQQTQQPQQEQPPQASKTMSDDTEALKGQVELDDVVEKLNTLRSGRSFKDSAVRAAMEEYFNSLNDAEKVALFAFSKGLASIVTGEVPGQQAVEPEDKPANIKMTKTDQPKIRHVKPNVIKKPSTTPARKPDNKEDTTPPAAITPQKR